MQAIARQLGEIDRVGREIKRTKSWKRKKDLEKYKTRLEKELRTYVSLKNKQFSKKLQNIVDK